MAEDSRARLEELQAQRDKLTAEIQALQKDIRRGELEQEAGAHLDSLNEDERSVFIQAAAIRVGAGAKG